MYQNFSFKYEFAKDGGRLGWLNTPHGLVETPAFIFCGTKASVKSVSPKQLEDEDTQIILANTYHLMLQPGADVVAKLGGLHKMMGWNKPILTDSGGFQIFSLGHGSVADEIKGKRQASRATSLKKITEEGAMFHSYLDGSKHFLTPELAIEIQHKLGPDFAVALDECTPFHVDKSYTERSMHMSHRWEKRSLNRFIELDNGSQALYGIVQGGVHEDLRKISANFVSSEQFFATAIGGSLGSSKSQMQQVVGTTIENLDRHRPIHLLGIGGISDIFYGVMNGIDTFDCVHPTRLARHGGALVTPAYRTNLNKEHINLLNNHCKTDTNPIEANCPCYCCQNFSRGYLHHLLKAKEMLAFSLISIHNISFMNRLFKAIRNAISNNSLKSEMKNWILLQN
jgi:queuine tRNA-ribosyltransferase